MNVKLCVYVLSLVVGVTSLGFAQDVMMKYDPSKGEYRRRDQDRVYVVGKVVNIAQTLQHRPGGADAQDALFSKGRQGFLTSGGVLWTFVDNIKAQELQWNKEYLGKFVTVHGWMFHEANYMEVDSFTVGAVNYSWNTQTNTFEPQSQTSSS